MSVCDKLPHGLQARLGVVVVGFSEERVAFSSAPADPANAPTVFSVFYSSSSSSCGLLSSGEPRGGAVSNGVHHDAAGLLV